MVQLFIFIQPKEVNEAVEHQMPLLLEAVFRCTSPARLLDKVDMHSTKFMKCFTSHLSNQKFLQMNIDQILDSIYILPNEPRQRLKQHITEGQHRKGGLIMQAGKIERTVYFISKGVIRAYTDNTEAEITFWFGKEGDTVLPMKSYVAGEKAYENIELLEDCTLYEIKIEDLQSLFTEDIHLANWGRKLAEQELVKTEERLISRQVKTALQRYEDLLRDYPYLIARVQLGHIASYLGITQVTLSRIRAEFK